MPAESAVAAGKALGHFGAELISAYGRNAGDAPMQTPASLIFHERGLYIANLAFFDPGVGKISVLGVPVAGAPIAH